jgi:hypothetical protein
VFSSLLSGCATSYSPKGLRGFGYEEKEIFGTKDIYAVEFKGNNDTPLSYVWRYILYRCAEITIEKNYDYFVILSTTDLTVFETLGGIIGNRFPHFEKKVKLIKSPVPPDLTDVYEAKEVLNSFGPFIKR